MRAKWILPVFSSLFLTSPAKTEDLFVARSITAKGLFSRGIEGPSVERSGNVYIPNFGKDGTIAKMVPGEAPQLWLQLPDGSISNATRFNAGGELLVADRKRHRILKVDLTTKKITVVAENPRLNQPNDFTIAKGGHMFLSDPAWSSKSVGAIWLLEGDHITISASDLKAVNGIDLSPDESKIYFTESIAGAVWVMDVKDKKLSNKRQLIKFKADTVDGLRVDMAGNIYVARIMEGKIDRLSPEGELLNSILLNGKEPTNLAFGGPDGKTAYVTMRDTGSIESFRVPDAGREWGLATVIVPAR